MSARLNKWALLPTLHFTGYFALGAFVIFSSTPIDYVKDLSYVKTTMIELFPSNSDSAFANNAMGAIITTAVMILYAVTGIFLRIRKHYLVQFADSLYYLGFLFTLLSLIASMYHFGLEQVANGANNSEASLPGVWVIIGKNAIALVTTVAGLFIRALLIQFRSESNPLDATTETLLKSQERLAATVEQTVGSLTRLRRTAEQELTAATKAAATAIHEAADRHVKETERAAKANADRIGTALDDVAARLGAVVIPSTIIKDRLEAVEIPQSLLRKKLEAIEVPTELLRQRLEAATRLIDDHLAHLRQIVSGSSPELAGSIEKWRQFNTALKEASSTLGTARTEMDRVASTVKASTTTFTGGVADSAAAVARFSAALNQLVDIPETKLVALRANAEQVDAGLKTIVENIVAQRKAIDAAAGASVDAVRDELAERVRMSAQQVENVHDSLVNLVNDLVQAVRVARQAGT